MLRRLVWVVLSVTSAGCPADSGSPLSNGQVTMTQVTDLPRSGGNATAVGVTADGHVVAGIASKLYVFDGSAAAPTMLDDTGATSILGIGVAANGDIHAITPTEIRTYRSGAGPAVVAPIGAEVLYSGRSIQSVHFDVSGDGAPLVVLGNNQPQLAVYTTADRGTTWTLVKTPENGVTLYLQGDMARDINGDLIADTINGFYRSTNGGTTWSAPSPAPLNYPQGQYGGRLFARANGDILAWVPAGGGLRISHDHGATFTDALPFNQEPGFVQIVETADGTLWGTTALGPNTEASTQLLRSTDGVSWTEATFGDFGDVAANGDHVALALHGTTGPGSAGGPGGVMMSADRGTTWVPNGTSTPTMFANTAFDKDGHLFLSADGGIYRRGDTGWTLLGSGTGMKVGVSSLGRIAVGDPRFAHQSGDGGVTWARSDQPSGGIGINWNSVTFALGLDGDDVVLLEPTEQTNLVGMATPGRIHRATAAGFDTADQGVVPGWATADELPDGRIYLTQTSIPPYPADPPKLSLDHGKTFIDAPAIAAHRVYAINHAGRYLGHLANSMLGLVDFDSGEELQLTLTGPFQYNGHPLTDARFAHDDTLCVIVDGNALYCSTAPVR